MYSPPLSGNSKQAEVQAGASISMNAHHFIEALAVLDKTGSTSHNTTDLLGMGRLHTWHSPSLARNCPALTGAVLLAMAVDAVSTVSKFNASDIQSPSGRPFDLQTLKVIEACAALGHS